MADARAVDQDPAVQPLSNCAGRNRGAGEFLEVERTIAPRQYAYSRLPRSSRFRSGANRSAPGVAAAFFPWPWLIEAIDPLKNSFAESNAVVVEAARSLREWLEKHDVEVRPSGRLRPTWKLVVAIAQWTADEKSPEPFRKGNIRQAVKDAGQAAVLRSELEFLWDDELSTAV